MPETAKALRLDIAAQLPFSADEVIELRAQAQTDARTRCSISAQ
jgi:hypothetical protein